MRAIALVSILLVATFGCQPPARPKPVLPIMENDRDPRKADMENPDLPEPFGYKCAWLAIRTTDPESVAKELELIGSHKATWKSGIPSAYQGDVFITSEIKGWVLAVSASLPSLASRAEEDRLTPLLKKLGAKYPDVQFFGTHRVVEYHSWARIRDGQFVRRFAYVGDRGETIVNEGKLTDAEERLGLKFNEERFPNEQHVMDLAKEWSIDPSTLDQLKLDKSLGIVGKLR